MLIGVWLVDSLVPVFESFFPQTAMLRASQEHHQAVQGLTLMRGDGIVNYICLIMLWDETNCEF